jgi:hypothetical protein
MLENFWAWGRSDMFKFVLHFCQLLRLVLQIDTPFVSFLFLPFYDQKSFQTNFFELAVHSGSNQKACRQWWVMFKKNICHGRMTTRPVKSPVWRELAECAAGIPQKSINQVEPPRSTPPTLHLIGRHSKWHEILFRVAGFHLFFGL